MPNAVIEDWDEFGAFLAAQPFCLWAAEKRQKVIAGTYGGRGVVVGAPPKDDNAALMAALSSMA